MTLLIIAMILIATLGYLAQTTGLCMVRGVNETLSGKPLFLLAILFSGTFSWISFLTAQSMELVAPIISYEVTVYSVIGGLLFGCGAAFNNGCGVSTISKLARGQLAMLATICGWLIGWLLLTTFLTTMEPVHFNVDGYWHYRVLVIVSIGVLLFISRLNQPNQKLWLSMLAIGLMASFVFLFEAKWTPSALLKDISYSMWFGEPSQWPSLDRFILIGSLIVGMVLAAVKTQSFKLVIEGWQSVFKHLIAGILMGVGAAIANGGNDSQLLLALPALSPAGFSSVLCMLIGIYLGLKILQR